MKKNTHTTKNCVKPNNRWLLIRIKTYTLGLFWIPRRHLSGMSWGCFQTKTSTWYQKLAVMIRNRLLASACRLLPLVEGVAAHLNLAATPFPSTVGVLYLFVCRSAANGSARKIKVISTTQKKIRKHIYIPEKIAQNWVWQGIATPFTVVMVTDWLRPPCSKNGGGSGSWHKSTRDPNSPGVNHPHDKNPLWGSQDAPRGSYHFCSDLWITINFMAADRHPPFKKEFKCVQKRHSTTSYSISYSQASAKWILYQGYILHYKDTSFFTFYIYAIIT